MCLQWRNTMMRVCSANDLFSRRIRFNYSQHTDLNKNLKIKWRLISKSNTTDSNKQFKENTQTQFNECDQMMLKIHFTVTVFHLNNSDCLFLIQTLLKYQFLLLDTNIWITHLMFLMSLNTDNKNESVTNNTDSDQRNMSDVFDQ